MIADFIPIKDAFNQMLLKAPKEADDNKSELESCIKNYASPEVLKGANQRFCEKCMKL